VRLARDGDLHGGGEGAEVVERAQRLGEDHVGADGDIGLGAGNGGGHALVGRGVGARHDDEVAIWFARNGGLHTRDHLGSGDQVFAGEMAAELGRNLVFNMHGSDAGGRHLADGAGGIVPAGVDVDQQRQVDALGNAAGVDEHIGQLGLPISGRP